MLAEHAVAALYHFLSQLRGRRGQSPVAGEKREPAPAADGPLAPGGNYRWAICVLLFAATTINYIDRQVIGILKPELQGSLGWSQTDFAAIVFWFQVAYAAGFLFSGRLADRIGCRVGLALAVAAWSLAEMGHAMVYTVAGFAFARFRAGPGGGRGIFPRPSSR